MIRPDFEKGGQSASEILKLSTQANHPRSRERFQALYMIGTKQTNATQWAQQIGRQTMTVMNWVHRYNQAGPEGIEYGHSGGRRPLFAQRRKKR